MGIIIVVTVDKDGKLKDLILEEKRGAKRFMASKEESIIKWQQIVKIGDDIILVDTRNITY